MDSLWQAISPASPSLRDYNDVEFWLNPEREGWLSKQGEFLKTWRRRWFVMKQGKLLWFKQPSDVTPIAVPRGVVHVGRCQVVKGAEDEVHKAYSFVVYIDGWPTYFVADSDKEKEEWVSSIGRVIVQHSGAGTPEIHNY